MPPGIVPAVVAQVVRTSQHGHSAYQKVSDERKRPIRGLWIRNGRYYAQITVEDQHTGHKQIRRVPLEGVLTAAISGRFGAPWHVDISQAVKPVGNQLEIEVINTWANRIIGDLNLPAEQRRTWEVYPHFKADLPSLPAGLVGPATIQRAD